jgi:uncharacterized protein
MQKQLFVFSILLFILPFALHSDPWGKDSDLVCCKRSSKRVTKCSTPMLGKFAETMIRFHQEVISPADGPRSHFIPSSSQYTLNAMRKYGFFKGFTMGCDRLMRENNDAWVYRVTRNGSGMLMKYDPVP